MFSQLLILIFYILIGYSLLFGLINLIRSNIYDVKQTKLRRQRAAHPYARRLRRRPLVSVIVRPGNNSDRCLNSLTKSSYKKLEILTANSSKAIKGELVLVIDGVCVLDKQTIKNGVLHFLDSDSRIVLMNTQPQHDYTLMGLADSLKSVLGNRVKKSGGLITPGLDARNYAALYKTETYKELAQADPRSLDNINRLRQSGLSIEYESLSIVRIHGTRVSFDAKPVATNNRVLSLIQFGRNLLGVCEPLVIGTMIYVAIRFNNPGYVLLAWTIFTALLTLAIWSDETQSLIGKLRLTVLAVIAYGLYLVRQLVGYTRLLVTH